MNLHSVKKTTDNFGQSKLDRGSQSLSEKSRQWTHSKIHIAASVKIGFEAEMAICDLVYRDHNDECSRFRKRISRSLAGGGNGNPPLNR